MLVIPAIDLQSGRCVRLKQGRFDQVTQFSIFPTERALYFAKLGAKRLHVVDLDGARSGKMQQLELICSMQNTGIPIQAGGGIRSVEQALECTNAGISQLVIGSLAITNRDLTIQIIERIKPENIILALDVRVDAKVPLLAINGWQNSSTSNLWEVVSYYENFGIKQILCTDIACDGMMSGPNFDLYQQAVKYFPQIAWQASGGIRHLQDITTLDSLGISAVILGLMLYQDNVNFEELLC
ncbi:TPA: 1-(5-phosphoribosyl)-5-[(5-phosphoribosylamino)methylideneamino] imidazole-4-carboxamide isomerase [Legionella pneumophila]